MRKAESYIGGHTLITIPPDEFDAALECQADEARRQAFDDQAEFDKARESLQRIIEKRLRVGEREMIETQVFNRLKKIYSRLNRESARWRVEYRKVTEKNGIPDHIKPLIIQLRREAAVNRIKLREALGEIERLRNLTHNKL